MIAPRIFVDYAHTFCSRRITRARLAALMLLILKALALLPLPVLYRMGDAVFFIAHRLMHWRHDVARANLARSFPEMGDAQREAVLEQSYRNLADLLAEIVWAHRATRSEIAGRVSVENPELITAETRAGRSVLLMTAHFCNWEWQVLAGNSVIDAPMIPVYKPQRLRAMDRFLRETRARFGGVPMPSKQLTRWLLGHRGEPNVYAMVADQTPAADEPKYWTRFLNQDSVFFVGADAVARILRAPVLFVHMRRVGRGQYKMRLSRLADPPYERGADTAVIERYVRMLEQEIRSSPADWLWVHKKWKYAQPAGDKVFVVSP